MNLSNISDKLTLEQTARIKQITKLEPCVITGNAAGYILATNNQLRRGGIWKGFLKLKQNLHKICPEAQNAFICKDMCLFIHY